MDIQSYMTSVGRQARSASRLVAKSDTATRNKALMLIATAIDRDVERLLDANARDLAVAREKKLEWIEGGGHIITVDYGRDKVFEEVANWIAAQSSSKC